MMASRKILMIPGPSEVDPEVLSIMARPVLAHYGSEWCQIHIETCDKLKRIFNTNQSVLLLPGPGNAAIDLAVGNLIEPGDKALNVLNGFFGEIFRSSIEMHGGRSIDIKADIGKAVSPDQIRHKLSEERDIKAVFAVHSETSTGVLNPIKEIGEICGEFNVLYVVDTISSFSGIEVRMDDWNIDICIGYASKALGSVNGIVPVAISDRAWKVALNRRTPMRARFLNLQVWKKFIDEWSSWGHPFPSSMPSSVILALKRATELALEEGLEKRYRRHYIAGKATRAGLRNLGFQIVPKEEEASSTITAAMVPNNINIGKLKGILNERFDILIAEMGALTGVKGIRIGHMGVTASPMYVIPTIAAIEVALAELGVSVKPGSGVGGAMDVFGKQ
jgi:aspartate aminotransferase-like enzyme